MWLIVFTCNYLLLSHTPACLLSSSTCFRFPIILSTVTDLAPLFSLCPPLLLPPILQMSVGSRTISRGSQWPVAPSLWSFPAIVPGLTAARLQHSNAGQSPTLPGSSSRVTAGNPGKYALKNLNKYSWLAFYISMTDHFRSSNKKHYLWSIWGSKMYQISLSPMLNEWHFLLFSPYLHTVGSHHFWVHIRRTSERKEKRIIVDSLKTNWTAKLPITYLNNL